MFPKVIVFHITRSDLLAQAVSMDIATQTQQWASSLKPKSSAVTFEFSRISRVIDENKEAEVAGQVLSKALGVDYVRFDYLEVAHDRFAVLKRALREIDPSIKKFSSPEPELQKQAGETNEKFIERYLANVRDIVREGGRTAECDDK